LKGPARYIVAVCLLIPISIAVIRVGVSGSDDLKTALACEKAGLTDTAIDFYGRAARWYLPFSSTQEQALQGLLNISAGSTGPEGDKTAIRALYEARGAILATRWLMTPSSDMLKEVNDTLARRIARGSKPGEDGADIDGNLAILSRTTSPRPVVSFLATLLFAAWVTVTIVGATRSVTSDGRFAGRRGLPWMAVSAALLFGWLILLALA